MILLVFFTDRKPIAIDAKVRHMHKVESENIYKIIPVTKYVWLKRDRWCERW